MLYRQTYNKFRAKKTWYNGYKYDSKFEARVAQDLDLKLQTGLISGWEPQYKIECIPYDCNAKPVPKCKVTHKVDFRVHELDGTYTLLEAKGFETSDYRMRRKWLLNFWLPEHLDHKYEVVKENTRRYSWGG